LVDRAAANDDVGIHEEEDIAPSLAGAVVAGGGGARVL
jgi:hypothetical protein